MNETRANRKAARVVCSLGKERGRAEFQTPGLEPPHAFFFFSGFLSPSARIPVVFLVAEPIQEIKYFVFLSLYFPERLHI